MQDIAGAAPTTEPNPRAIQQRDAKAYFDYLVGIVTGTVVSRDPDESNNLVIEATDQLDEIIVAMTPDIEYKYDIYAMPNWEQKLDSLENKITGLEHTYQERWDKLLTAIERLQAWLIAYTPTLDEAQKDYATKVKKLQGGG
jgi:hypothetical protein